MSSISLLPEPCRSCVAWELSPDAVERTHRSGLSAFEKEVWLSGVMLTWGSAGQIVTVDDQEAAAEKIRQYGGEILSAKGEGALKFRAPDGTIAEVVKPGRYNEK